MKFSKFARNNLKRLSSQRLWKIQLVSFILVALIPLLFLSINLYRLAWENAWKEIAEKHQLLATNMAAPIENYVSDHKAMLKVIANSFTFNTDTTSRKQEIEQLIDATITHFKGYKSITLVDASGQTLYFKTAKGVTPDSSNLTNGLYRQNPCFLKTKKSLQSCISNIQSSPVDKKPTFVLSEPILIDHKFSGELVAELKIEPIESLRKKIHFGKKGHSAIVDATGHVIAHPNPDWMKNMRDLSHLSIVKKMMSGKTGVTEFYSPFIKANMIAGYTSVPGLGWGIMVPQPKSEITVQVNKIMLSNLIWAIVGLCFALALSWVLVRWISTPIVKLSSSAQRLLEGDEKNTRQLLTIKKNAPKEIQDLSSSLASLFKQLQYKNIEVEELNKSLQQKVDNATQELRLANKELKQVAQSDHLTSLASRRHFIDSLTKYTLQENKSSEACVLLIDLDNFKDINDHYGHLAGDALLVQISNVLTLMGENNDVFARYGGDEFAAILFKPLDKATECAEKIRSTIANTTFTWQENSFTITVSIGVFNIPNDTKENILSILEKVDSALYEGKKAGRNTVVEFSEIFLV